MGAGTSAKGFAETLDEKLKAASAEDISKFCEELGHEHRVRLQVALGVKVEEAPFSEEAQDLLLVSALNGDDDGIRKAIIAGARPNMLTQRKVEGAPSGLSATMYAARAGMHTSVRTLKDYGSDIDLKDEDGWAPVHYAARFLRRKTIDVLHELGADMKALTNFKRNIVDLLEELEADTEDEQGDGTLVKDIMEFVQAKGINRSPQGEMFRAARNGHTEDLRASIAAGADVKLKNVDTRTALSFAAEKGSVRCLTIIAEAGAPLEDTDRDQWTAVHYAAAAGEPDCLETLHKLGASLSALTKFKRNALDLVSEDLIDNAITNQDDSRKKCVIFLREQGLHTTPHSDLFRSAKIGDVEGVRDAIRRGAELDLPNASSYTPLMCAADMGHVDCVKVLKELGANTEMSDRDGWTAVHFATYNGQVETLKALSGLEADLNVVTRFKRTAIDLAEDRLTCDLSPEETAAYKEVVAYLSKKGVKPSPQGQLMKFAKKGDIEGCKNALEAGADENFTDFEGFTAAQWAHRNKHKDCLKFLISKGAVFEG